jgi:hypothetical protein
MPELHEDPSPRHPALAKLAEAYPGWIRRLRCQDGEVVLHEGDPDDSVYFLEEGSLVIEQEVSGGSRYVLKVLSNSEDTEQMVPFGEISREEDGKRSASIRSSGGSVVVRLDGSAFESVFKDFPDLARILNLKLVERLRDTNARIKDLVRQLDPPVTREMVVQSRILFQEGEPATAIFQCAAGTLHEVRPGGSRLEIEPDEEGFVDAAAYFRTGRWTRTVEISAGSFLLSWSTRRPADVFRFHPELALRLLRETK